jgi:hypothetical protein
VLSNGEVERRGIALAQTEAALSQAPTPPWFTEGTARDRSNRLLAGILLLCVDLVKDIHSGTFASLPSEVLPDANASVREKLYEADRAAAMNPACSFSLRIPEVHRMTHDAAYEIPALNAAALIAAEYPAASL